MIKYKNIFQAGKINNLLIRNRIVFAPMGNGLGKASGEVSEREKAYFTARAKGGCGLIFTGYAAVSSPEDCGIAHTNQIHLRTLAHRTALQSLAESIHKYSSVIFAQLHHPGSMAPPNLNNGQQPLSSSPVAPYPGMPVPREMTIRQIQSVVKDFATAAENCFYAGIDGVLVHGAHGYLLDQFINPRTNLRRDEYGGSFENRMRIVVEVIEAIRAKVPKSYPVAIRLTATDGTTDGINVELAVEVARYLSQKGIDAIDVSMTIPGSLDPPSLKAGWKSQYIKPIKDAVNIPVIAVNSIKTPEYADKLIADGVQDFVSLGRAQIADPEWGNKARQGLDEEIVPCLSCCTCHAIFYDNMGLRCAVNPLAGREVEAAPLAKDGNQRKIAVIGAGPAGIEAALTAAKRGFRVTLYDKSDKVGGSLQLANKAPNKEKIDMLIKYYERQLKKYGVDVLLNSSVEDLNTIKALKPYAVILAVGGKPIWPKLPGNNLKHVVSANDILSSKVKLSGKSVAVIGAGMTGIETAEFLSVAGNNVTVYEMLPRIGQGMDVSIVWEVNKILKENKIALKMSHMLKEITETDVIFENRTSGETVVEKADAVVFALGVIPDISLLGKLHEAFDLVLNVGDCVKAGRIQSATSDGYWKTSEID